MPKDRFKKEIADITVEAFRRSYPDRSDSGIFITDGGEVYNRLETPKNQDMGNYALPLFELAKELKANPMEVNKKLAEVQNQIAREKHPYLTFTAVGGFNNSRIAVETLAEVTVGAIMNQKEEYGSSSEGRSEKIVIDFSSPNIAKPFGIGHLRTTALGHALYRIFEKIGYECIGINHLGDWGTQFGKLIVAFRQWGNEKNLDDDPIQHLYDLYVRFHREEENDKILTENAREAFKRLEDGWQDEAELWNKFREYSLEAFNRTYRRLGIVFDYYWGEAFYNDKIPETIDRLKKAGLTRISEGALIVELGQYGIPDCLLAKADGATLYATRDIAAVLYRWQEFHFDQALYVVGSAQRDHFRQVFKVIELLEEAEKIPPENRCAARLHHIEFGWIKFKDEDEKVMMMSTRLGNIILLDDVLDRSVQLARSKIKEKNPGLKEIDRTAEMIGVGAILFSDMSTRRHKDVNFVWQEVLNFEGESGPYLQYTHARLSALLRRYGREVTAGVDFRHLDGPEEYRVLDLLYKFPGVIGDAAEQHEPYVIVAYLFELAAAFNRIYQRKDEAGRIVKIISDNDAITRARMALVTAVRTVIREGLYLLGIEAPEEM